MRNENEQLKTENRELTNRLGEVEKKLDDLEGRSKRNNLIFSGLQKQTEADYESWEDCECPKQSGPQSTEHVKKYSIRQGTQNAKNPLSLPDSQLQEQATCSKAEKETEGN